MADLSVAGQQRSELEHGVSLREAFYTWLRVAGLSFGGPAGQIAVMHRILVEEKRWVSEERFLHALNYCMLLPGPEAQQLATYIGWLMHRTLGGIMAGVLFVIPGIIAIMALSYVYAAWGNVPVINQRRHFIAVVYTGKEPRHFSSHYQEEPPVEALPIVPEAPKVEPGKTTDTDGKPADRETLLARLRDHIHTVVGRYKGKIHGWDVVNEAIEEDGSRRKSPWQVGIGDDYVAKAFEFAHEADPDVELYYNDFNLEKPAKRAGVIKLVKDLQARKLRIDGIGNQAHWRLDAPAIDEIDTALVELHGTGLKVMYTELDINLLPNTPRGADPAVANPYANGLPDDVQKQLTKRYADVFGVFVKHRDAVTRVTSACVARIETPAAAAVARARLSATCTKSNAVTSQPCCAR